MCRRAFDKAVSNGPPLWGGYIRPVQRSLPYKAALRMPVRKQLLHSRQPPRMNLPDLTRSRVLYLAEDREHRSTSPTATSGAIRSPLGVALVTNPSSARIRLRACLYPLVEVPDQFSVFEP